MSKKFKQDEKVVSILLITGITKKQGRITACDPAFFWFQSFLSLELLKNPTAAQINSLVGLMFQSFLSLELLKNRPGKARKPEGLFVSILLITGITKKRLLEEGYVVILSGFNPSYHWNY